MHNNSACKCGNNILKFLRDNPVLYHGRGFNIVGFGLFASIEAFAILILLFFYLSTKGTNINTLGFLTAPSMFLCVWGGARVLHWFALGTEFLKNPKKYIRETGFYMQGGVVGGILWAIFISRNYSIPFWLLTDAIAWGALLGQFFGRLGCYNYGCCFGRETKSPLAVCYTNPESKILRWYPQLKNVPVHPSQIYMAVTDLITFILITFLISNGLKTGYLTVIYMIWHGISRIAVEQFRSDIIFKKGRNWVTFKFALALSLSGVFIYIFGSYLDASFSTVATFNPTFNFQGLIDFYKTNFTLLFPIFVSMIIAFIGYGIHGEKLGTFPLISIFHTHAPVKEQIGQLE
jgi:prolipoprotein diacylglyceryl transferase